MLKKRIITIMVLLVMGIVLIYIGRILTTGTINVSTNNNKSSIIISESATKNGSRTDSTINSQGKLSTRLKPGLYQITVSSADGGYYASSKIVHLKARQNIKVSISPVKTPNPEPIFGGWVSSSAADAYGLSFLDQARGQMTKVGSDGLLQSVSSNNRFVEAKWANKNLALARDNKNLVFELHGSSLIQISLPFKTTDRSEVSFDISRSGMLFVSDGHKIYSQLPGSDFREVYHASKDEFITGIFSGSDSFAALLAETNTNEQKTSGYGGEKLVIMNFKGGSMQSIHGSYNGVSWSPNGDYLVASGEGPFAKIYDKRLKVVDAVSVNNADHFVWIKDGVLAYSVKNSLWLYDTVTKISHSLAILNKNQSIINTSVASDGAYIYFASDDGETKEFFKVGLKGQNLRKDLYALSVFLPEIKGSCILSYINFSKPVMTVQYPSKSSPLACQQIALNEILYYKLTPQKIQLQMIPYSLSESR